MPVGVFFSPLFSSPRARYIKLSNTSDLATKHGLSWQFLARSRRAARIIKPWSVVYGIFLRKGKIAVSFSFFLFFFYKSTVTNDIEKIKAKFHRNDCVPRNYSLSLSLGCSLTFVLVGADVDVVKRRARSDRINDYYLTLAGLERECILYAYIAVLSAWVPEILFLSCCDLTELRDKGAITNQDVSSCRAGN